MDLHYYRIVKYLEGRMRPKWFLLFLIMPTLWIQTGDNVWAQVEKHTAFVNVNLVPMTDETIIHGQTVLVKGTRITAIGLSNTIDIPDDSMVIDGSNSYLIEKKDFTYLHRLRDFWIKIPGRPQIGTYTIEVTSVKDNGLASDL